MHVDVAASVQDQHSVHWLCERRARGLRESLSTRDNEEREKRDELSTMDTMPVKLGLSAGDIVGEAAPDSLVTNTRCALAQEISYQFEGNANFEWTHWQAASQLYTIIGSMAIPSTLHHK